MAKAPAPGAVKTRLRVPPEEAAELATAMLRDAVEKAQRFGRVTVAYDPPSKEALVEALLPGSVRLIPQIKDDLGERMLAAASLLFEEAPTPVLILGTDAPTLPPGSMERAALALEEGYDASIIGSSDGGYVLLGLGEPRETLFRNIAWSHRSRLRTNAEKSKKGRPPHL